MVSFGTETNLQQKILSWQDSIDLINGERSLSKAARKLCMRVIELGRIFPLETPKGTVMVLDVKRFLNHRVDTDLMWLIGENLAKSLKKFSPDLILTAPSSGISPALAVAFNLGRIPIIYTQKSTPITFTDGPVYHTDSFSYTTNKPESMTASGLCIPEGTVVVGIDDFLDTGHKSSDLKEIADQAGANLVAFGYGIEKSQYMGRKTVMESGLPDSNIFSVLDITALEPGRIQIKGMPHWLSLKNNGQK